MNEQIFNTLNIIIPITLIISFIFIILAIVFRKNKKVLILFLLAFVLSATALVFENIYQSQLQIKIMEEKFFEDGVFEDTLNKVQDYLESQDK